MIGIMGGVARTALSNAPRQVAREFGWETMEKIVGGETVENVLTKGQMRELARR